MNVYHFSLLSKNESGLIKSTICMSVCVSAANNFNLSVDFHEILSAGDAFEGDFSATFLISWL
jgi:hypothetical protein